MAYDWECPPDAICTERPTCMFCGQVCENTEIVYTGDEESYAGFEMWCYCEKCKTDTFHKLIKFEENVSKD